MAVGRACLALSRFAAPRPSFCFVLFLDKTDNKRVSIKRMILNDLKVKPKALEVPFTLRYNALLTAFGVILTRVFISRDFGNYYKRHSFTPRV